MTKTSKAPPSSPTPASTSLVQGAAAIAELAKQRPNAQLVEIDMSHPSRTPPATKTARERALAGNWRVKHGSVVIPIPLELRLLPNGEENPYAPVQVHALPGDVVWLNDEDAARMFDDDTIEPVDAKPSKVGKVWTDIQRSLGYDDTGKPLTSRGGEPWDYRRCEALKVARDARNRRTAAK